MWFQKCSSGETPYTCLKDRTLYGRRKGKGMGKGSIEEAREGNYGLPFAYVHEMSSVNKTNGLINDGQDMPHLMQ